MKNQQIVSILDNYQDGVISYEVARTMIRSLVPKMSFFQCIKALYTVLTH